MLDQYTRMPHITSPRTDTAMDTTARTYRTNLRRRCGYR
jgi:hypothetical protein